MTRTVSTAGGAVAPGAGVTTGARGRRHAEKWARHPPARGSRRSPRLARSRAATAAARTASRIAAARRLMTPARGAFAVGEGAGRGEGDGAGGIALTADGSRLAKKRATARATASATVCWNSGLFRLFSSSGVGDERHLDEDRRHRRADEHAERRLLDAAVRRVGDRVQLDLDRLGELARLLQVRALREVPEDEVEVGVGRSRRRGARRRAVGGVLAAGDLLRDLVGRLEREVVGLGALGRGRARRVGVDRKEEVRLLVVGDRGAVVERDAGGPCRASGRCGRRATRGSVADDPLGDLQRGVLLLQARPGRWRRSPSRRGPDRRRSSAAAPRRRAPPTRPGPPSSGPIRRPTSTTRRSGEVRG